MRKTIITKDNVWWCTRSKIGSISETKRRKKLIIIYYSKVNVNLVKQNKYIINMCKYVYKCSDVEGTIKRR